MELRDFYEGYNFGLPDLVLGSAYWRFVLSNNAKVLLPVIYRCALNDRNYAANGVLLSNIKNKTLIERVGGMSLSTLCRTIDELDALGIIVKLEKNLRNNRYFLGFIDKKKTRYYLLYHLILKHENAVKEYMDDRLDEFVENRQKPRVIDPSAFRLKKEYRMFIRDFGNKPRKMVNKKIKDGNTLIEVLFQRKNFFEPQIISRDLTTVRHQFDV